MWNYVSGNQLLFFLDSIILAYSITALSYSCFYLSLRISSSIFYILIFLKSKSLFNFGTFDMPVSYLSLSSSLDAASFFFFTNDYCFFSCSSNCFSLFSVSLSSMFIYTMNYCFSLVWDNFTTCDVILVLSLWSSSFLSSIFSFNVWFSIFNCSKSIKCNPSASWSFLVRIFCLFANLLRNAIFCNLYWWTS